MMILIITTVMAVMIMMMVLFCVSANLTLHFDVVCVGGRCLTVCASFYTHIHTGRLETRLLILIGASQTHLW